MKQELCIGGFGVISNMGIGMKSVRQNCFRGDRPARTESFSVNGDRQYPFALLPAFFDEVRNDIHLDLARICMDELADSSGYGKSELCSERVALLMGVTSGMHKRWRGNIPMRHDEIVENNEFIECRIVDELAEKLGFRGPSFSVNTACASSLSAVVMACNLINANYVDRAVVGAIELLNWYDVVGFSCANLLSQQGCRPFDQSRDGLMLGEAAAFILIGRLHESRNPYAKISSFATANEAFDIAKPEPSGRVLRQCIMDSLTAAQLTPTDIDYVNAHGTGTLQNDASESAVYNSVWPASKCNTVIGSTKGIHGHTRAAGGVLELLVCLSGMLTKKIPYNKGCIRQDGSANWKCAIEQDSQAKMDVTLNVARGFGGHNVVTILEVL